MGYCTKAQITSLLPNIEECQIEQGWIDWASSQIENYTGVIFGQEVEKVEFYDIDREGQDSILLEYYPITSVEYVKDDGNDVNLSDIIVYNKEGIIALRTDTVLNTLFDTPYFTKGRHKVEVKYKYGYTEVPQEIQMVCALYAADLALCKLKSSIVDTEKKGEKIGEYSIDYTTTKYTLESKIKSELEKAKKEILNKYRIIGLNAKAV